MSTAEHQEPREWLSVAEIAALLGCSGKTVRRRIASEGWMSKLDSVSKGPPLRFIRASDVYAYIKNSSAAAALDKMSVDTDLSRDTLSQDNPDESAALPVLAREIPELKDLAAALQAHAEALREHTAALQAERRHERRQEHLAQVLTVGLMAAGLVGILAVLARVALDVF